jgi:anaerobic selenocysteine-containing dehydrogenase
MARQTISKRRSTPEERAAHETRYRDQWRWDKVAWASHCIDCYPGNCPMRVYLKDGKVWREEQAAIFDTVEAGVPDMNPMGCQKGAGWSHMHYSEERVLYPLKRVGKRGGGKWKRISWDQALTEVADAVIDAIQEQGPESIIHFSGCNLPTAGIVGRGRFASLVGASTMDLNAEMNDFAPGNYMTYGVFDPVSSIDDWFHSEMTFIWFSNPATVPTSTTSPRPATGRRDRHRRPISTPPPPAPITTCR